MNPFAKYRTAVRRIFANIFDTILLALPPLALTANGLLTEETTWKFNLVYSLVPVAYSILMHFKYGQTLGKMALGIKVISLDEVTPLSLRQAMLRDSVCLGSETIGFVLALTGFQPEEGNWLATVQSVTENSFSIWFILEAVTMLTNSKRRAVHDFLADTVVVKLPASAKRLNYATQRYQEDQAR